MPQTAVLLLLVVLTPRGKQPMVLFRVKEDTGTSFTQIVVSVKAFPQLSLPRLNLTV